jgi:hypothetical protein
MLGGQTCHYLVDYGTVKCQWLSDFRCSLMGTTNETFWITMEKTVQIMASTYLKMPPAIKPFFPCLIGFCGGATCNLLHRLHYNGLCSSKPDQPICLSMKPLHSKSGGNSGPPLYGPTQFSLLSHQWYIHISSILLPVVHTQ